MNVTFEISKKLKDAGINLTCDYAYITNNNPYLYQEGIYPYQEGICEHLEGKLIKNYDDPFWFLKIASDDYACAPTIEDVLKYFRDESMYNIFATHYWYKSEMCWQYNIDDLGFHPSKTILSPMNGEYMDWEDAIMNAIDTVLNKLLTIKKD